MGFGPLPGGLKPWNSAQTLFDGANLYYSDGTTFVDSSGNVTLLAGTIDGMVIGGNTPENAFFGTVRITSDCFVGEFLYVPQIVTPTANETLRISDLNGTGVGIGFTDASTPSTPTAGFVIYSISGQPHTKDVNAVDINLSLCPQPSAIYALPLDVGDPTQVIASTASLATIQTSMNLITAGSGDALFAVCQLMKAIQSGFNAGPAQYPVAS